MDRVSISRVAVGSKETPSSGEAANNPCQSSFTKAMKYDMHDPNLHCKSSYVAGHVDLKLRKTVGTYSLNIALDGLLRAVKAYVLSVKTVKEKVAASITRALAVLGLEFEELIIA